MPCVSAVVAHDDEQKTTSETQTGPDRAAPADQDDVQR